MAPSDYENSRVAGDAQRATRRRQFKGHFRSRLVGAATSLLGISSAILLALIMVAVVLDSIDDAGDVPDSGPGGDVGQATQPEGQASGKAPDASPQPASDQLPTEESGDGPARGRVVAPAGEVTEQPAATEPERESSAASCPERCLIRVPATGEMTETLAAAGTRASWANASWVWTVATRDSIVALEEESEATLVTQSSDTLRLYVVIGPDGEQDDSLVEEFGEVLDTVDQVSLVQVESVPAVVTPLIESGYAVEKILPAPPQETDTVERTGALADIDIGTLANNVSSENLEQTILELQATSSTDGSGAGTRYYSATGNAMAAEYLVQRMERYGLRVWYEDFVMPDGRLLVNVVGEVAGRDPNAIYGVLSHYDTLSTDLADSPGADDNATGIAGALEIARILSAHELQHPLRLVFVSAEEVGIIGADQFARRAVAEEIPYRGIFNIDAIGSDRQGTLLVLNTEGSGVAMQELMVEINESYGLGQEMLVRQNPAIVADDNKLRDQGLPAVLVSRELYGWSTIHHTPDDLINYVSIPNTASATTLVLLSLATLVR